MEKQHFMFNCSFCGKSKEEVFMLITGPEVSICDNCVELCSKLILEKFKEHDMLIGIDYR